MYKVKRFSKDGSEDKLNLLDRANIAGYKMKSKKSRERSKTALRGELDPKDEAKWNALIGGAASGISGAITGYGLGGKKGAAIGSAIGALGGGSAFGALGYGSAKLNNKLAKSHPEEMERELDSIKVAEGEMSKSDFKKKWYK